MKTKIVLADDHQMVREGLRAVLDHESDLVIIGEASSGQEVIQLAREQKPDIIVMDVAMPELGGVEATRRIKAECPETQIVALSMHTDRRFVTGMLGAGASGYVLKSEASDQLVGAIRAVQQNRVYTSPQVTDMVMADYVRQLNHPHHDDNPLSAREREVLVLLAEGHSTRQMAELLYVSTNTIDTHRRRIMAKLDLHTVAELTKYAIRHGLTSVED